MLSKLLRASAVNSLHYNSVKFYSCDDFKKIYKIPVKYAIKYFYLVKYGSIQIYHDVKENSKVKSRLRNG